MADTPSNSEKNPRTIASKKRISSDELTRKESEKKDLEDVHSAFGCSSLFAESSPK